MYVPPMSLYQILHEFISNTNIISAFMMWKQNSSSAEKILKRTRTIAQCSWDVFIANIRKCIVSAFSVFLKFRNVQETTHKKISGIFSI